MSELAGSILVVDDNEANRDLLSRRLERRGFTVATAEGGTRALECIAANRYDLVILDVIMPDIGGIEVLRRLRERWSAADLPVILATAKDESEDIVDGLKAGANDYVTKPLDMPVVIARVQTQLSLKRANERLAIANARMERELRAAARIQESMLPAALPDDPNARFAWLFRPCAEIAGDGLNIFRLNDDHAGMYVLDVVDHGVASALLSVAVSRVLTPAANSFLVRPLDGGGHRLLSPRDVATQLSQRFPWDASTEQFFTLIYGVINLRTHELRFVCAGHPPPLYVPRNGEARSITARGGLPIGLDEERYEEHVLQLHPGDRVYLYSDGFSDAMNMDGAPFQTSRILDALAASAKANVPLDESLTALWRSVEDWSKGEALQDDASIAALEIVA